MNTATMVNSTTVYCGLNCGDFEFERDRHYWRMFICQRIKGCFYLGNVESGFNIIAHKDADKAIISFDELKNITIFNLIRPTYINLKDIV